MSDRENRMEEALVAILGWCNAYPIEVFPPPDLNEIRAIIGADKMAALHGTWGRHILAGVRKHAESGLRKCPGESA